MFLSLRCQIIRPVGRSNAVATVLDGQTVLLMFLISNAVPPLEDRSDLLPAHAAKFFEFGGGGAYRDRTDDLLNANQALSQLS